MRSIRDVAVFASVVTGINPTLANYGQGRRRIGTQPADGLPAWEPNNSRPTTYPPPEDLSGDRAADIPKDPSTAAGGPLFGYYASERPIHGYHTRHASLDENLSEAGSSSSRPAAWAPAASHFTSSSTSASPSSSYGYEQAGYHHHHHQQNNHRRPPLRQAFLYDAMHDHARYQRQASLPASASEAAARRCNFSDEPWGAAGMGAESREACLSGHGEFVLKGVTGGGSGGGGEASKGVGGGISGRDLFT